jgi:hypothetical protein
MTRSTSRFGNMATIANWIPLIGDRIADLWARRGQDTVHQLAELLDRQAGFTQLEHVGAQLLQHLVPE